VLLDGEIVAVDEDGKTDFAALWFRKLRRQLCEALRGRRP
jgi:ATP-dependent DNA ligase